MLQRQTEYRGFAGFDGGFSDAAQAGPDARHHVTDQFARGTFYRRQVARRPELPAQIEHGRGRLR
ncbi:MAG TPA: hypothetical protein VJ722_06525, partial [Rhodanobacteraceae bacterium]|nr:hypothetical protein [Rhodanobacteraceae bacterium]